MAKMFVSAINIDTAIYSGFGIGGMHSLTQKIDMHIKIAQSVLWYGVNEFMARMRSMFI